MRLEIHWLDADAPLGSSTRFVGRIVSSELSPFKKGAGMNRRGPLTPLSSAISISYRADRHRDPRPIYNLPPHLQRPQCWNHLRARPLRPRLSGRAAAGWRQPEASADLRCTGQLRFHGVSARSRRSAASRAGVPSAMYLRPSSRAFLRPDLSPCCAGRRDGADGGHELGPIRRLSEVPTGHVPGMRISGSA
jgi:hypothetical protein